ncbi:MAG: hypothetical protein JXR91_09300 [Deltaproteobacteria bacterium]|nr:hypothetical protein [Deltaproteobacteria bacterium]
MQIFLSKKWFRFSAGYFLLGCFVSGCSSSGGKDDASYDFDTNTALSTDSETINNTSTESDDGICTPPCNAFTPDIPTVEDDSGSGSVTTYGSVTEPEFSNGGACNYGATGIKYYAAIHVNIETGDNLGPWQEGHGCGGCMAVRVKTEDGWQDTFVRITDRCPDEYCGVDLGGAPAADVMTLGPGRYDGQWMWQSCEGHPEVFDGPTCLFVKDGSNEYWALIQVRNPLSRVTGISYKKEGTTKFIPLDWAKEAENFYTVPQAILQDSSNYTLKVEYDLAPSTEIAVKGSDLSVAESIIEL